ncbi:MAG TPA: head GIN domain-containing protein [Chitinophagaceae bacterium]|nr:head GIN domain-containing protein [Chitinophagaceae bacterium]
MRKVIAAALVVAAFALPACDFINIDTIHGNGNLTTETRNVSSASDIESHGFFDVEIVHGSSPSVKIEADENLIPYILTENEDGKLVIHTKDHVGLSSNNKIKVYVTTDRVDGIALSGSGNVTSDAKLDGSNHLRLSISGSGDMTLDINTPYVESSISGSGNINLSGETKDSKITITGNGDYKASDLQAENAEVHITGSGSVNVATSVKLTVRITGSGDVYYKGSPAIEQHITGSGTIKQM